MNQWINHVHMWVCDESNGELEILQLIIRKVVESVCIRVPELPHV